jgi:hypothetical protein
MLPTTTDTWTKKFNLSPAVLEETLYGIILRKCKNMKQHCKIPSKHLQEAKPPRQGVFQTQQDITEIFTINIYRKV